MCKELLNKPEASHWPVGSTDKHRTTSVWPR